MQPVVVQLVSDAETGGYRVMVVCRRGGVQIPRLIESIEASNSRSRESSISETAEAYDSKTGLWTTMNSGYVHGRDRTEYNLTKVFDCKSRKLLRFSTRLCLNGQSLIDGTVVKNHVFALHSDLREPGRDSVFVVAKLADHQDNPGILSVMNRYRSMLGSESNDYSVVLFGSDGLILLVADNGEENFGDHHHQLVHMYNNISRQEWHKLPVLNDIQ